MTSTSRPESRDGYFLGEFAKRDAKNLANTLGKTVYMLEFWKLDHYRYQVSETIPNNLSDFVIVHSVHQNYYLGIFNHGSGI